MTFQISAIYLYGVNGEIRRLGFELGALNIITGRSQTGKSSIISIIDYCLGSSTCSIPAGVIRQTVLAYGLRIAKGDEEAILVRPSPEPGKSSSTRFHLRFGQLPAGAPAWESIDFNSSLGGAREFLNRFAGIDENLHVPALPTREPLAANIRHSLFYVFQAQDEIASRNVLFHSQAGEFKAQAIRDSLPYFLGAQEQDFIAKRNRLAELRRELRVLDRRLDEGRAIDVASGQAQALVQEAANVGLLERESSRPNTQDEALVLLRGIVDSAEADHSDYGDVDEYDVLLADRERLRQRFSWVRSELYSLRRAQAERRDFSAEIGEQRARLLSIDLLNVAEDEGADVCPICDSVLATPVVKVSVLRGGLARIEREISSVRSAEPELQALERRYDAELRDIKERLRVNQDELESIVASRRQLSATRDDAVRTAVVRGRIGFYLDSRAFVLPAEQESGRRSQLLADIEELEDELDVSNVQDRLESILSVIGNSIRERAHSIGLEHSANPIRLDLRRLTLVADTPSGPVTLGQIGSGENWLGYHIALFVSLHEWFEEHDRPVPRFLILDQPSQVYFPPDQANADDVDLEDDDRRSLGRILELVLNLVESLAPNIQVIMMDHADLDEEWFQKAVEERWRPGAGGPEALIPANWVVAPGD